MRKERGREEEKVRMLNCEVGSGVKMTHHHDSNEILHQSSDSLAISRRASIHLFRKVLEHRSTSIVP